VTDRTSGEVTAMTQPASGYAPAERYQLPDGRTYLTGIQALVRVVLDQARRDRAAGRDTRGFVSGYEGSPLAGYDLELIRRRALLDELGIVHRPAVNEELAATAIVGTQLARSAATLTCDGITGWWYGKSPGLDRATDALRHANLIGTDPRGGAVVIVGDDPAAKSSTVPGCSEAALADLAIPTLLPADPQEILEFAGHAVQLSRMSGLWAALRVATVVADSGATVQLRPWSPPDLSGMPPGLTPHTHTPHRVRARGDPAGPGALARRGAAAAGPGVSAPGRRRPDHRRHHRPVTRGVGRSGRGRPDLSGCAASAFVARCAH
jgi:indolepyruvate ferredoxin oxidoreductase